MGLSLSIFQVSCRIVSRMATYVFKQETLQAAGHLPAPSPLSANAGAALEALAVSSILAHSRTEPLLATGAAAAGTYHVAPLLPSCLGLPLPGTLALDRGLSRRGLSQFLRIVLI